MESSQNTQANGNQVSNDYQDFLQALQASSAYVAQNNGQQNQAIQSQLQQLQLAAQNQQQVQQNDEKKTDQGAQPKTVQVFSRERPVNADSQMQFKAKIDSSNTVKISTGVPDVKDVPPSDLVCVVDVSYSMGDACSGVNDGHTEYVELAYSLLDLTKHALNMIVNVLGPKDRLAVVLFTTTARVYFDFTHMDEDGKKKAHDMINVLKRENSTNIYDGIKTGIELIERRTDKTRNPSILFFTDGVPNNNPREGNIQALQNLKEKHQIKYPVHTMGFGQYNKIESGLIFDIAKIFNGMNGYIPDPTCIGTVFVNTISNILTTQALDAQLFLSFEKPIADKLELKLGDFEKKWDNGLLNIQIDLGCLRYGQDVDILMKLKDRDLNLDGSDLCLNGKILYESQGQKYQKNLENVKIEECDEKEILPHTFRYESIDLLKKILSIYSVNRSQGGVDQCINFTQEFYDQWKKFDLEDNFYKGMIQTLERQTLVSLKKDKYMEKWGMHQYRQTIRALNLQYKGNFRDPCLAHFGGEIFEEIADKADDIFNNMPPPEESLKEEQARRAAEVKNIQNQQQFQQVLNSQTNYMGNNGGGNDSDSGCRGCGCFTGDSLIEMRDGSKKPVHLLKKGDQVKTPAGFATIRCLVKFKTANGMSKICTMEKGLKITPGHPIMHNGKWVYPREVVEPQLQRCEEVYNLVVDREHVVIVNEVPLILMGHDYKAGILQHDYYGSHKVIQDFEKIQGWTNGYIEFSAGSFTKQKRAANIQMNQQVEVQH